LTPVVILSASPQQTEYFCKTYDLQAPRPTGRTPFTHQSEALRELNGWFARKPEKPGGILALPTGGGKTFTAWNFLCRGPLSEGYKVLWLAHTHHLLEQAFYSLEQEVGNIQQRKTLTVRVVSGTKGHFRAAHINPEDDVVIATLQTARNAYNRNLKTFHAFIESAGRKLFVVFDEAHHAPATSYCQLLNDFRNCSPKHFLLGLTATPTYNDSRKKGWLAELFQQKVLYTVNIDRLIQEGILAKPIYEHENTRVDVELKEDQYRKWMQASRDLPDDIVTQLAENQGRNELIAEVYARNSKRYGKTIIFADRKVQCVYLKEALRRRGIEADFMFTFVEAEPATADERNKIEKTHNKEVLEKFKNGELQVLINVQMLTTGTDIPDVESVFLTRQTTSQILLTQMVGRALRGPKAGGTEQAYVVCFIDNWQQVIDWADFGDLEGETDLGPQSPKKQKEIEYISIDLIRNLAKVEVEIAPGPFLSFMPIGWYLTEIELVDDNDDSESVQRLAMVFEHEKDAYNRSINFFQEMNLEELENLVQVDYEEEPDSHSIWAVMERFFPATEGNHNRLLTNLYRIAKHIAQNCEVPEWFNFDARKDHDLDEIAQDILNKDLRMSEIEEYLQREYEREDRFWRAFYHSFNHFTVYFDACVRRVKNQGKEDSKPNVIEIEVPPGQLDDETKAHVRERDRFQCQCCGVTSQNDRLQVDHIKSLFHGGTNNLENLQLLCKNCNQKKEIKEINFRKHESPLSKPDNRFPDELSAVKNIYSLTQWERCLRKSINFFYRASVVKEIRRVEDFGHPTEVGKRWEVYLYSGNNPKWIQPHLRRITSEIRQKTRQEGIRQPTRIIVSGDRITVSSDN
jgi:superfamily II DNA or RNA helicase/5-methylcytosine-specific restriction endonuclease McrA